MPSTSSPPESGRVRHIHADVEQAAFVRARRLAAARQHLLTVEPGVTLDDVAHAAGFLVIGEFEAAYRALFGESPEETRRNAGGAPAPRHDDDDAARRARLTTRERDVCARAARGMLNKQIAAELGIAEGTVKVHRARGMAKLGVTSAVELARFLL